MDDDRSELVQRTLAKGLAMLVGIAVVIALGTFLVVRVLGLDEAGTSGDPAYANIGPSDPLPSHALPGTTDSPDSSSSGDGDGDDARNTRGSGRPVNQEANGKLRLSVTPLTVSPMERINLTGTYGHHDNVSLQVQRLENGTWADFPTEADVSLGTFATYIQTSRTGANKFRVYDPRRGVGSNVVTVTVR